MRRFVALLAAIASVALASVAAGTAATASVALTKVSGDPYTNTTSYHATEVEPDTFSSGSTIVSAFQSGRFQDGGSSNIGFATSTNAGASYTSGFLPGTTVYASPPGKYARATDPSVAFDAKHNVWLINSLTLTQTITGIVGKAVIVNRSQDGGLTWGSPVNVAVASSAKDFDKNWIACDNHAASPYYGNCYVEWDDHGHSNHLKMAVSSDGGSMWTHATVPASVVIGGQPLAMPNGTVVVPIDNGFETGVESFVSSNGGLTYTGPYTISTITAHSEAGSLRSGPLPTAEIDSAGTIYVAWSDCRFRNGCAANDIVYSTSSDGTHWSSVTRVPIDATSSGVDHFLPGLAVDARTTGRLGLTYYYYPSTSCSTSTCQLDVGFVGSSDGGATWTTAQQLAGPSSLDELPDTTQGFMVGDYISMSFVTPSTCTTTTCDVALSVFAVGMRVSGATCTLGSITSCNEPMEAPASGLSAATAPHAAAAAPVLSTRADHAAATAPTARR